MNATKFFKKSYHLFIMIAVMLFFITCKKDVQEKKQEDVNNTDSTSHPAIHPADLTTKVISSVSGFVTDENNVVIPGVVVKAGMFTTTTDTYGFFEIKNAEVVKNAAVVIATMPGYFKGIKTYIASNGKAAFFRIKLIPKSVSGTINANSGGEISLTNGFKVSLPANAVVNAATGVTYSGNINVASRWMDPVGADIKNIMPGDLRGLDINSSLKILRTYGMAAVELTSDAGEVLQIASGKKATLTMTIPAAILSSAPATIPMWYFDETIGLWKQDGVGTKTGNTYVGEASHFSFWDYSTSGSYVNFNCTIVDANGFPLRGAIVEMSEASQPSNLSGGTTDTTGYIAGAVPENTQLVMDIFADNGCIVNSQTFTTTTVDLSLGTVSLAAANTALITGNVLDCNGAPVIDGFVIMTKDDINTRCYVSAGTFSFSTVICGATNIADFVAEDHIGAQTSAPITNVALVSGTNNLGNIAACGTSIDQFIIYDINSGWQQEEYWAPADSISMTNQGAPVNTIFIKGNRNVYDKTVTLGLNNLNGAPNNQIVNYVVITEGPYTNVSGNMPVLTLTITEYGPIGGFISGSFDGTIDMGLNGLGHMTGSFRVKRTL